MPRWSTDGEKIYFQREDKGIINFWEVSLKDGHERQLTDLQGRYGSLGWFYATDGPQLYFTWYEDLGDIWVMEVGK